MSQRLTFLRVAALVSSITLVAAYLIFFRPGATAATDPGKEQSGLAGAPSSHPATKPAQADTRPANPMIFLGSKSGAVQLVEPPAPTGNTPTITQVVPGQTRLLPGSKSAEIVLPASSAPQPQKPRMLLGGSKSRAVVDPVPIATPTPSPATSKPTTPPATKPAEPVLNK
jgi:hypothetical protein